MAATLRTKTKVVNLIHIGATTMSRVWIPVVLIVAFFAYPLMDRLQDVIGAVPVGLLSLACVCMAAWLGHTTESAALADDFRFALRQCGISQKECSITMGISEPVLANQLSGKEQLSFWRVSLLGHEFQAALAKRMLARNSDAAVIERGLLTDLVDAVTAMAAEQRKPRRAFQSHAEVA